MSSEQFNDPKRKNLRRHNRGHSLFDKNIVSVLPLAQERSQLCVDVNVAISYKLNQQVGRGGFGRVYAAVSHMDNGEKIAIKRVPHDTTKQKRKNYQEVRFLKYLNGHPNMLRFIRATIVKDNELWLATEYVQGGTLTQAVAGHAFTEPEIAYIARELMVGVQKLHSCLMAHRDLKSANVMIDFDGNVKLIDFGLCSDMSQGVVTHMVGSPFWMPPEMIRKQPHGMPVDIWSFGITIMELANGHPPYRKSSIKAMFVAATAGYPEPFEDKSRWSPDFHDFLSRCLQVEAGARPSSSQVLEHPFLKTASTKEHMKAVVNSIFNKKKEVIVVSSAEYSSQS